ncbi:hypothetical protein GCM10010435_93570 [Winogradskya consettensis]|uniref:histidine kinase n=2 Tax=Winogradskya consettensis TaxID=113560 RepID=A0A919T3J8_9ACTN|nr:hypothetical protein Aco04nite_91950 [Actinoplanes consettensis]
MLAVLLATDLLSIEAWDQVHGRWVLVSALLVGGLAVLADDRPVRAALAAAGVLTAGSVGLWLTGYLATAAVGTLTAAECGATAVLIVAVLRRRSPRSAAAPIGALLFGVAVAQSLRLPYALTFPVVWWYSLAQIVVFVVVSVLVGVYLRHRDQAQVRAAQQADLAARQRERLVLARELHDVVAHQVGAMVVQAQAAQAVLADDPGAGRRALPTIETAGREALDAMRRLVTTMRDVEASGTGHSGPPTQTADLLADLRAAVAAPPDDGPPVRLTTDLAEPVPAEIAGSVLRVVREATANARRHAAEPHGIEVSVRAGDGVLRVHVADDGTGRRPRPIDEGYGLVGVRERVELLGGSFSAGHDADVGGWQVTAEIPLHG